MPPLSAIADELLRVLLGQEEGMSDEQIRTVFGQRYELLAPAINELLTMNRVQLFTQGSSLVYKAIKEEIAQKFEGLGPEQLMVHQAIEKAGNRGIWTRDIKIATNIPQQTLTKTLKTLEQRLLIKSVRSVVSKSKKLYVLYDVVPAKSVTGGPWYSDQEFDYEFVAALSDFIVNAVNAAGMMDQAAIADKIRTSGVSNIELSAEEIELVVNTLVYDGRLEEIQSSVLMMSGYATGKKVYKVSRMTDTPNSLTTTPCGICPVRKHCVEGGLISPTNCVYMGEWLDDRGVGASEEHSRRGSIVDFAPNTGASAGGAGLEAQVTQSGRKRRASSIADTLAW